MSVVGRSRRSQRPPVNSDLPRSTDIRAPSFPDRGAVDGYIYDVGAEIEPDLTQDTRVLSASAWNGFPTIAADSASGVLDIFHAMDRAVAGTGYHLWKDGKF